MTDEHNAHEDWLWGIRQDEMFLLPRSVVGEWSRRMLVLQCTTWGEVAALGEDVYLEVLGISGYTDFDDYTKHLDITGVAPLPGALEIAAESFDEHAELPRLDDPFDVNAIPSFIDGDWPPSPNYLMEQLVPAELIEEFGDSYSTVFNGRFASLRADVAEAVLARCETLGMNVVADNTFVDLIPY